MPECPMPYSTTRPASPVFGGLIRPSPVLGGRKAPPAPKAEPLAPAAIAVGQFTVIVVEPNAAPAAAVIDTWPLLSGPAL